MEVPQHDAAIVKRSMESDDQGLIFGLQPDGSPRILAKSGVRTWEEHGFVHHVPALVVEDSKVTRYVDFGPKRIALVS
jgi:hypothetical protein